GLFHPRAFHEPGARVAGGGSGGEGGGTPGGHGGPAQGLGVSGAEAGQAAEFHGVPEGGPLRREQHSQPVWRVVARRRAFSSPDGREQNGERMGGRAGNHRRVEGAYNGGGPTQAAEQPAHQRKARS